MKLPNPILYFVFGLIFFGCDGSCVEDFQILSTKESSWFNYEIGERINYVTETGAIDTLVVKSIYDEVARDFEIQEAIEVEINGTCHLLYPRSGSIDMRLSDLDVTLNWTKDNRSGRMGTAQHSYWRDNDMNDSFMVGYVIGKTRFLIFNSATSYYDSLTFRNILLKDIYEYRLKDSASVFEPEEYRRVLITPKQGIVYLERRDGRTWFRSDLSKE